VPKVEWQELARADLLAIVDYVSDDNPDAAQHLKDDIEAKAAKLPEFPKLYRAGRVEGTREMVVGELHRRIHGRPLYCAHPAGAARRAAVCRPRRNDGEGGRELCRQAEVFETTVGLISMICPRIVGWQGCSDFPFAVSAGGWR